MVVSWPAGIADAGSIRSQFTHLIDLVPTILDVAGIPAPDAVDGSSSSPLDDVSIRSTSADPAAQHTLPWRQDLAPAAWENDRWELYHLDQDFSENHDLAAEHPDKLQRIFDAECERYGGAGKGGDAVLRLDGTEVARARIERTVAGRFGIALGEPGLDPPRKPSCTPASPPARTTEHHDSAQSRCSGRSTGRRRSAEHDHHDR